MNRKFIFLILTFLVTVSIISSFTQISDDNSEKNVRVMIEIKEPIAKKTFSSEKNFRQVSIEKEKIKEDLIGEIGEERIKNDFGNSFSATLSEEEIKNLKENDDVKNIKIVNQRKIFLQDSIHIVNASLSWKINFSSQNLTGKGETICLIDTGVDYTHPDLGGCYGNNNLSSNCKIIGGIDYCADDLICNSIDSDPIDSHGHGTHIAGIISANGIIKGIAPDSKIIAIKAGTSSGVFYDDDLMAGIDWCINNASKFNISIISLSLGAGLYDSYCEEDPLTSYINNATAKNISVIVATGNNGNYTHIAGPACVKSAISVGGSTKDFTISFNRNSLTDLIAPAININSTKNSGGYFANSGTSMSTPHVAGTFAILRQFFKLQNLREPTPEEVLQILKSSGKIIEDTSGSKLNFSQIEIYSAIASIENKNPVVELIYPQNNYEIILNEINFNCTVKDPQLSNLTFYLWNSTGLVYTETREEILKFETEEKFNVTNLSFGNYKWNCLAYDLKNNFSFSEGNNSLVIFEEKVQLNFPENNSFASSAQLFNCSITSTSEEMSNVTFYLWNSSEKIYELTKNISDVENLFEYNFSIDGNYEWGCIFYNKFSDKKKPQTNFSITYDKTAPTILSLEKITETTTSHIKFNTNEETNFTIKYGIDELDLADKNETLSTENSIFLEDLENSTTYHFSLNVFDKVGNVLENYSGEFKTKTPETETEESSSSNSENSPLSKTVKIPKPAVQKNIGSAITSVQENKKNISENKSEEEIISKSPLTGFAIKGIGIKNISIGAGIIFTISSMIFIRNHIRKKKISNIVEEKFNNLENLSQ